MKRFIPFFSILLSGFFAFSQSATTPITLLQPIEEEVLSTTEISLNKHITQYTLLQPNLTVWLNLLAERPQSLTLSLPFEGGLILELEKTSPLAHDFILTASSAGGGTDTLDYSPGLHYSGKIAGMAHSLVAISIFDDQIMGVISDAESNINLGRINTDAARAENMYAMFRDIYLVNPPTFNCAVEDDNSSVMPVESLSREILACPKTTKFYLECAYKMYQDNGSNTTNTTNFTTALFNVMATLYQNEQLTIQISQIFVWTTADSYPLTSSGDAHAAFVAARPNYNGDIAHLLTTAPNNIGGYGNWWIPFSCTSTYTFCNIYNSYSPLPTYSWSVSVMTHETGHNFGCNHTHWCGWAGGALDNCYTTEGGCPSGPQPMNGGTIMSYCHLNATGINFSNGFGIQPGNRIRNTVENATCIYQPPSPTANFSSTANGFSIAFTNTSTNANSYSWDFGDNQTSTQANPTHTYSSPGNYNVCLTATGTCGSSTSCQAVTIAYDYCWHWQNPLSAGESLNDVYFVDANTGWIVGQNGIVLKTMDGGLNWINQTPDTFPTSGTTDLSSVHFVNNLTGWTVGANTIIMKTTDGGSTWASQTSGISVGFADVFFTNNQTGWAIGGGGTIRKTMDGGTTWVNQTSGISSWLHSIHFVNDLNGWVVGQNGIILRTINGGTSWTNQSSGVSFTLNDVYFYDNQIGWAVGANGTILKTLDGGLTWSIQISGTTLTLNDIHFSSTQSGWAAGDDGTILKSIDGGISWIEQQTGTLSNINALYFIGQKGIAVGNLNIRLYSINAGAAWQSQTESFVVSDEVHSGVHFVDNQKGWVVGTNGLILHTMNGGAYWQKQISGTSNWLLDAFFIDAQIGFVVGANGTILKTINGGTNWQLQTSNTSYTLNEVVFTNSQKGWIVGNNGTLLKTNDGGFSWEVQNTNTTNNLNGISFSNNQIGCIVGNNGIILNTTDGGTTWASQILANKHIYSVFLLDSQKGWLIGQGGLKVNATIDGGVSWQPVSLSGLPGSDKYRIFFLDSLNGYTIDYAYRIFKTSDGGISWSMQATFSSNFNVIFSGDLFFQDSQNGWAVGGYGTILKLGIPTKPFVQNLTLCKNTPANELTAIGENLRWYFSPTGGIGNTSAPIPNTSAVGSTTYYVSQSPNGFGTCTESERAAISVTVTAPAATISTTNSCNNNGTATITATGSDLPYSYLWSNGQTSSMITNLASGTYTVTLTNTNGCSSTLSASVSSALTTSANFGFSSSGLSVTFSNTSSNATSYFWNFGNGQTSTATNPTFTYSTSGTYNVCLTATGDCGSVQSCQTITVSLQNDACWQSLPSGTTNWLRGVHFWDNLNGIAVGAGGIVLKTINGGATWQSQNSGTTIWLLGIYFVDNQLGWAVGSNGLILKTNNGGVTWQSQPSGTTKQLEGVHFVDSQTGWAIGEGGTILKTNNGGASWQSQNSGITTHLYEVQFIDSQTGWAVGNNGAILKTNNGGAIWQSQSSGTNKWLRGVHFINSQTGWTVGELGTILKTNDSGISWQSQPSGTTNWLWVVHFIDSQTGWTAGGSGGGLYKTINGGATWQSQNSGTPNILYDIQFIDSQTGWVVGDNGTILKFGEILPPTVQNITLCKDAPSQPLTATGTNLLWYTTSTGGTGSTTAPMPNTSMVGAFTYYVSQSPGVAGVCGESQRVPLIVNITQPSISMTYTSGCPSGTAEVTVINGGAGAFTYSWSNGQTSSINTNVPPGAFGVTVTDSNGCQVSQVQVMSQGMPPLANVSNLVSPCIGQSNGSATVTASGGVAPYTFNWSNGQTGATANNLMAGNHFVTVTGNNGCFSTATATISTAAAPTVSISSTVSPCVGQATGSATVTASGGVSPYTFIWSNGQTGATANNLVAGNYFVTVTGNNGCSSTATATISTAAAPTLSIGSTVSPCVGQATGIATVTASGGVSPYTFIWSNGQTGATANNLVAGNYFVTVTGNNGCTSNSTVILTDVPVFSVELTTNLEASGQTCQSNAVPQSGASPYTYLWSNGLTTQTASNLPSGQFSVSVTDASGCISIQTGSCMPVSANEIAGIEFFSITPNPAQSYLFIQIRLIQPEQLKMRFFNSIGQLLHENSYNSNIIDEVIDLNKYPSGCYFVQFTTHNGSKSEIITITR